MSSFFATVAPLRILLVSCMAGWALGATKEQWRDRSIYQIMTDRFAPANGTTPNACDQANGTYCGGTWRGIQDNLDYIQGMGFDAIWMSPIVAQMPQWTSDGMSYAGYWQQNLYEINQAFGNETELQGLITSIHERGMYFMMDIVVNHMAFNGKPDTVQYGIFQPFNDEKYFHPYLAPKYDDHDPDNSEMCWMGSLDVPLVDIDTTDSMVRQLFSMWIKTQVWKWGVDGLRIDAGINVEPEFFTDFMEAAGVFATAEVYTAYDEIMCQWEATIGSVLNYPLYWKITDAFQDSDGDMSGLSDMFKSERSNCKDPLLFGTFSENHDVPRFANHTTDLARAQNVAAFVVMSDGIPVAYQGSEQHYTGGTNPFTNREPMWESKFDRTAPIYQTFSKVNTIRRHAIANSKNYTSYPQDVINQDDHTIALRKGVDGSQTITLLNNNGASSSDSTTSLCDGHGFAKNTKLTDIISCNTVTVDNKGCISASIKGGAPVVLYATNALSGSTLCGAQGKSDVDPVSVTVSSMVYTTTISGTPTMVRTATTIPLSEITPTGTSGSKSAGAVVRPASGFGGAIAVFGLTLGASLGAATWLMKFLV